MTFSLDTVVPWGRAFTEYARMFALSADDSARTILGCGDGPASFNAEATAAGWNVTSCDPLYAFNADEIRSRIDATYRIVLEQTRINQREFVWTEFASPDELGDARMLAMSSFLSDFEYGQLAGRYIVGELPALPFLDHTFDLALCSHFLFLYSDHLGRQFHLDSISELLRVAREVRVFPLIALNGSVSPFLDAVVNGPWPSCEIVDVDYEFVRGANQMLRITE